MSLETKMAAAVQGYFTHFNAGNVEGVVALYADTATVEDPVGTPKKVGKAEILEFYTMAIKSNSQLEQIGTTRIAANEAAFAFTVHVGALTKENTSVDVDLPEGEMKIDVIDIFKFDDNGKVTKMRAYWGPTNIRHK